MSKHSECEWMFKHSESCIVGLAKNAILPQLYHKVQSSPITHTFAYIIDISDHKMASEVFNTSGSIGAMPKRVIMQADYFWEQDTATATAAVTTGPGSQIGTTLSGVAQGLLNAATETVPKKVDCHKQSVTHSTHATLQSSNTQRVTWFWTRVGQTTACITIFDKMVLRESVSKVLDAILKNHRHNADYLLPVSVSPQHKPTGIATNGETEECAETWGAITKGKMTVFFTSNGVIEWLVYEGDFNVLLTVILIRSFLSPTFYSISVQSLLGSPAENARAKLISMGYDAGSFWEQSIVWGHHDSFRGPAGMKKLHDISASPSKHGTLRMRHFDVEPQILLDSGTELRPEPELKTIYIVVMGVTSSGKTMFINTASGLKLRVGMGLESCTNKVQMSQAFLLDRTHVILVDTPSFNDMTKSSTDVLKMISFYLQTMHKQDKLLSGVIYMHRISTPSHHRIPQLAENLLRILCSYSGLLDTITLLLCTTLGNPHVSHHYPDGFPVLLLFDIVWLSTLSTLFSLVFEELNRSTGLVTLLLLLTQESIRHIGSARRTWIIMSLATGGPELNQNHDTNGITRFPLLADYETGWSTLRDSIHGTAFFAFINHNCALA
ncbi:uncharacterized protein EDB91DRAFT_1082550 [Suillus paluster]|uniref:uncharacterized protein n=1 Tax=Suillus paluster TaxID=48578 RepID=UPI001B87984B|nr:uncharacterized protein EDB91DRAFT_1082550 [Suillus paluster]KAG1738832.1 hypothetical protein EDB91DRAFT_1082550 [Suillus paluster]